MQGKRKDDASDKCTEAGKTDQVRGFQNLRFPHGAEFNGKGVWVRCSSSADVGRAASGTIRANRKFLFVRMSGTES